MKNRLIVFFILSSFSEIFVDALAAEPRFEGKVIVEWIKQDGDDRLMRLIEPFKFIDNRKKVWSVPKDTVVDGASIPRILWSIVGSPFVGDYREASVVHDYYCDKKSEKWKDTHRMFFEASLADGVDLQKAKIMYLAVYSFGPRWETIKTIGLNGPELLT